MAGRVPTSAPFRRLSLPILVREEVLDAALQLVDVLLQVGLDGDAREYTIDMSARILGGDGSAGDFALAAALFHGDAIEGEDEALTVSGGNVDADIFRRALDTL